jgi:hypothetical protein
MMGMAMNTKDAPELFAAGFGACWAKLTAEHPQTKPPFKLTDDEIERAWMIHVETSDVGGSSD